MLVSDVIRNNGFLKDVTRPLQGLKIEISLFKKVASAFLAIFKLHHNALYFATVHTQDSGLKWRILLDFQLHVSQF